MFGARCSVDIRDWYVYVLVGNSDTSLLLFPKGHFYYKPVNSDWMFKHFRNVVMTDVT